MKLPKKKNIMRWAQSALQGKIVRIKRPSVRKLNAVERADWFVTAKTGQGKQRFYVRCGRNTEFLFKVHSLRQEVKLLELLYRHDIPVPKVIAASDKLSAVVMEFVEGADNPAVITDALTRDKLARHFSQVVARWHDVPVKALKRIGFFIPQRYEDYVLPDLRERERQHRNNLRCPVPLVTYACQWLRNHIPPAPPRPVLLQGDTGPGQFIFRDARVRAVIDWETASMGDPMFELAHMRIRNAWYQIEGLPRWFDYYSEYSGTELDWDRIRYYSVNAALLCALALAPAVQNLHWRDNCVSWLAMNIWSKRTTVEMLAEAQGISLTSVPLPVPVDRGDLDVIGLLEDNLSGDAWQPGVTRQALYRQDRVGKLLIYARNIIQIGREIEDLELDDMGQLLGRRPPNTIAGNIAVEKMVRAADPRNDPALIGYFYRNALREQALMRGAMDFHERAIVAPLQKPEDSTRLGSRFFDGAPKRLAGRSS